MHITTLALFAGLCAGAEPEPVYSVRHDGEVTGVAYSPDGKILATASAHRRVILRDARTGKPIRSIDGPHVGDAIAFSPDGKLLATSRNWQSGARSGLVHFWNIATGKLHSKFQADTTLVRAIAFSPDGKRFATHSQASPTGGGFVRVWDVKTQKRLLTIPTRNVGHTLAFSPDGKLLAYDVGDTIHLANSKTGKRLRILEGHQLVAGPRGITSGLLNALAFSADGKHLASASYDNMARIWDVATGKTLHVLEGHRGPVDSVVFSRNGKAVLTGGEDGTIRLWETATGKQLHQIQAHRFIPREDGDRRQDVFALAFSPDGTSLVSCGRDTAVRVWDAHKTFNPGKR